MVTTSQISLFNRKLHLKHVVNGLNLRGCLHKGSRYLYAISDSVNLPVIMSSYNKKGEKEKEKEFDFLGPSGLYVYNTDTIFKGQI